MPKQKIEKYIATTPYPRDGHDANKFMGESKLTFDDLLMLSDIVGRDSYIGGRWVAGEYVNFNSASEQWRHRVQELKLDTSDWKKLDNRVILSLVGSVFRLTEEHKRINEAFLAEYDSREDLQEVYKKVFDDVGYLYNEDSTYYHHTPADIAKSNGWDVRPQGYYMWHRAMDSRVGRRTLEVLRESPFEEGDLVVLRLPYVGNRDYDPEWVSPHNNEGKVTPAREIPRTGMLMGFTDRLGSRKANRGSRLLKVLWFGHEEPQLVQENKLKFLERPTKKNGMKK